MSLQSLEIVTPHGRVLNEQNVAKVVVRRFEERFETGGQVVFLPHHGSETVHMGEGELLYVTEDGRQAHVAVNGGFAEIEQDRVTVLTYAAQLAPPL